jgi:hypothetical protein
MTASSAWRIWQTDKRAHTVALTLLFSLLGYADVPQLQFVKITAAGGGTYGPPIGFGAGETLGLRISGLAAGANAELRVYGLVNRSPDHAYDKNQTVLLLRMNGTDLRSHALADNPDGLIVALSTIDIRDPIEVTAGLTDNAGAAVGGSAKLTLNRQASVQSGPSMLRKAMASGAAMLQRLGNIYEVIRDATEPRSVFSVALADGKATGDPLVLSLDRAEYRALAVSQEGNRLAWVKAVPGGYELWATSLDKIVPSRLAASPGEMRTPQFAGENLLAYVSESALTLADLSSANPPSRAIRLPFRSVARIDLARRTGDQIECTVSAEHTDTPGLNLPYMVRIPVGSAEGTVFRLPLNPYYQTYPMTVEGAPFFFAGSENGVEGIHFFQLDGADHAVHTLFQVRSPGLAAIAANGSRLVFAGIPER